MGRRVISIAAVVLAVGGLFVGTSTAQAPVTETIIGKDGFPRGFRWVQGSRPNQINVGDVLLQLAPLLDPSSGDQIGSERFTCTLHFGKVGKSRDMFCIDQIRLSGRGALQAQGIIHLGKAPDELAIIGGTHEFNDVAGTVDRTGTGANPTLTINLISH
jgi:hypothetical protein